MRAFIFLTLKGDRGGVNTHFLEKKSIFDLLTKLVSSLVILTIITSFKVFKIGKYALAPAFTSNIVVLECFVMEIDEYSYRYEVEYDHL